MRKVFQKNNIQNLLDSMKPINSATRAQELDRSRIRVWNSISHYINSTEYKEANMNEVKNTQNDKRKFNLYSKSFVGFGVVVLLFTAVSAITLYTNFGNKKLDNSNTRQTLAARFQELYDISRDDFKSVFGENLTEDEFNTIVQRVDDTKVTYKKYKVTYNIKPDKGIITEGGQISYLKDLDISKPLTSESWNGGFYSKGLVKQEDKVKQLFVDTPNLYFHFTDGPNNPHASKKTYLGEGKSTDGRSTGDQEIYFLKGFVEDTKSVQQGELTSWYEQKLINVVKNQDKTTFVFERLMDDQNATQVKEAGECLSKKQKENKSTKVCSLIGFLHNKTYIDIYPNDKAVISKTEEFDRKGQVSQVEELTDSRRMDFDKSLFNYNELSKNVTVDEQPAIERCKKQMFYSETKEMKLEDTYCFVTK